MRLYVRSLDNPAFLIAHRANDGHGLRAQLPHHDLIARLRPRERLPEGSLEILTPERALPVRGIDLDEVGEIRTSVVPIVRGSMIDESACVDAVRRLNRLAGVGAHRLFCPPGVS